MRDSNSQVLADGGIQSRWITIIQILLNLGWPVEIESTTP